MGMRPATKFLRVRKVDVDIAPIAKQDGLSICLECWKLYMLADDRDLSASRMKLGGGTLEDRSEGYESDPYGDQRKADIKIGDAVNTSINDLKPAHRWAVHKACGISTVWNFPSVDYVLALGSAHAELEKMLRRNVDTAIYFQ